ncbi:alpha-N-acetylglucosaminidase C-terminal domain-containing protein [Pedobacter sp. Du54]
MKKLFVLILMVCASIKGVAGEPKEAIYAMIKRILPNHAQYFEINFIDKEAEKDVFELKSRNGKILLSGNNYAWQRYGASNKFADEAWRVLRKTVYSGGVLPGGPESIITGRPTLAPTTRGTRPQKNYVPKDFLPAWKNLILASAQLKNSDGFQYDLVDVTRQALVNYADTLQRQFAAAYKSKDVDKFKQLSDEFVQLMDDVDRLLATRNDFLLGKWINDARKWGVNEEEKKLFERNAKNLVSLWVTKKVP